MSLTYRELQATLSQYQVKGVEIKVSLKAQRHILEAELERIRRSPVKVDETKPKRDVATFKKNYASGLKDEEKVKAWLISKGHKVTDSTPEENKVHDIDCYVDGIPTSIKAQHKGASYGNIYMELEQQLTSTKQWVRSWWYNGKAEQYIILQGETLRLYKKADIQKHVAEIGWSHQRTLSPAVKATQGGTYRFCDTRLGFLNISAIAHKLWDISK